ncbi:hypothetical protein PR202_gb02314 [Eleusine coracana subsp. coracana]|uniref:Uncharacterized protein n=1 Tax=Eleusine coracana subsp. coracana TaxID=191504 RepID=A0AAV5DYQ3_ELECO|nr:hypothetical protein PR202_gb02314 [Eleusine coracana subsp. coracana]
MASSSHPPPPPPPHFLITPKPDPDGPLLPPNPQSLALTPELCDILHKELEPSPDDDPAFARLLIQSQLHLQALAAQLPSLITSTSAPSSAARASPSRALRGIYLRQEPSAGIRNRADLRASSKMLSDGRWLHREHRIVGHIPRRPRRRRLLYRAELCVVGLHTAPQAGIGYIPASIVGEGHPVATSIVSSGGYLDDEDTGDVLIYTGSGGRQRNRLDHNSDQTLERGNLALHNSFQYGVEVRVIRGHTSDTNRKVYVYDGLYRVVGSTFGPGKSGRDVCKFKLVRLPGQDDLGSKTWTSAKLLKDAIDAKMPPPSYTSRSTCPAERNPCNRKNAAGSPYNEDGTLVMGRPVVYECGALCGCPMTCVNRVTQRGMKHRLEVFRSTETEWGVRTLDLIQPGAFVCEYSGDVVIHDDKSKMEERCIIDPKKFPTRWTEWGYACNVDPDVKGPQFPQFLEPRYLLDVSRRRSVACYISHSSTPNVFLQYVLHGNEDESWPHLMVFAMETIPPMRELSIDYGM